MATPTKKLNAPDGAETPGTKQMSATTPTVRYVQILNGHRIQIFKSKKTGDRVAVIDGNTACCIPLEILSLAAGKDEWMRGIEYKCNDCGERRRASVMECFLCPDCYENMINGDEFNQQ